MKAKRGGSSPDWLADARPGLAEALAESLPDLEVLDRDLDLGAGRSVDFVAVDGCARPVALVLAGADEDAVLLSVLDARAWFAQHRDLLESHFKHPRLDPLQPPRVVLIAEAYSDALIARLAGVDRQVLQCFELRRVASGRGERVYLVPARLPQPAAAAHDPTGARELVRALNAESAALAERLLQQLLRADDEFELGADGDGVRCSLAGEALCGLQARRGGLRGWVGQRAPEDLLSPADGEAFLEAVLGELRRLLPAALGSAAPGGAAAGAPDAFDPAAPLLTPAEIAAFQEP